MNLFDYTYCGNYNRQIQNLSRIVPEKWSFGGTEDNGILKGYLEHTFQRVYEEGKILETENYAIFNTGLFNRYYQPVYVYFIPNQVPDRQRWFLEGFYTEYYLLKSGIDSLPKRAEYVQALQNLSLIQDLISFPSMNIFLRKQKTISVFRKISGTVS